MPLKVKKSKDVLYPVIPKATQYDWEALSSELSYGKNYLFSSEKFPPSLDFTELGNLHYFAIKKNLATGRAYLAKTRAGLTSFDQTLMTSSQFQKIISQESGITGEELLTKLKKVEITVSKRAVASWRLKQATQSFDNNQERINPFGVSLLPEVFNFPELFDNPAFLFDPTLPDSSLAKVLLDLVTVGIDQRVFQGFPMSLYHENDLLKTCLAFSEDVARHYLFQSRERPEIRALARQHQLQLVSSHNLSKVTNCVSPAWSSKSRQFFASLNILFTSSDPKNVDSDQYQLVFNTNFQKVSPKSIICLDQQTADKLTQSSQFRDSAYLNRDLVSVKSIPELADTYHLGVSQNLPEHQWMNVNQGTVNWDNENDLSR